MNIISICRKVSYLKKNQDWRGGSRSSREVLLCDHLGVCSCEYRYTHSIDVLELLPELRLHDGNSNPLFAVYFLPMYLSYFYKDTILGKCQINVNVLTPESPQNRINKGFFKNRHKKRLTPANTTN